MAYSGILNEHSAVIIYDPNADDTYLIEGVLNANFSYSTPRRALNILGAQTSRLILDGSPEYRVSMNQNVVFKDYFLDRTGDSNIRMYLPIDFNKAYDEDAGIPSAEKWIFLSGGAITNYGIQVEAGNIPRSTTNFIFDNDNISGADFGSLTVGWNERNKQR
jgi:hypothetical protein